MSHLEPILAPVIEAAGFRLVRLRLMGGKTKTLQIMAERPDGTMNVEDCAVLSHALLDFIEAENPIEGDFEIEVSSPGIDRPLTRLMDFARYAGHEAKIEMAVALDGRKRFRGILTGVTGDAARLRRKDAAAGEAADVALPIADMAEARLVLTDALVAESLRRGKERAARHADNDNDNRLPANAAHANENEGD